MPPPCFSIVEMKNNDISSGKWRRFPEKRFLLSLIYFYKKLKNIAEEVVFLGKLQNFIIFHVFLRGF